MWFYWRLFLGGLGILGRCRRDRVLENLILRQQLAVWERSEWRPRLQQRDRQFWSVTARGWPEWRAHLHLVQPATVVVSQNAIAPLSDVVGVQNSIRGCHQICEKVI